MWRQPLTAQCRRRDRVVTGMSTPGDSWDRDERMLSAYYEELCLVGKTNAEFDPVAFSFEDLRLEFIRVFAMFVCHHVNQLGLVYTPKQHAQEDSKNRSHPAKNIPVWQFAPNMKSKTDRCRFLGGTQAGRAAQERRRR